MALTWSEFNTRLFENGKNSGSMVAGFFELTARCNLNCKMCYVCRPPNDQQAIQEELTAEQWLQIGEQACREGLLVVTLTGGEVFLRPDFFVIYEGLMRMGLLVQIYSNGTLITEEVIHRLRRIPPAKVSITLYGATRQTCRAVTGSESSYDRAVKAIDGLIEAGIRTEIKTTVIRENQQDFTQLTEFARQRKLQLGVVNYVSKRREGDCSDPAGHRLSPEELIQYELQMMELHERLRDARQEAVADVTDVFEAPMLSADEKDPDSAFSCWAGKCSAWFAWNGSLLPCGLMGNPAAYPLRDGVKQAWQELKNMCALVAPCRECLNCQYAVACQTCPGRLFAEQGTSDQPAPYLCEAAQLRSLLHNRQRSEFGSNRETAAAVPG